MALGLGYTRDQESFCTFFILRGTKEVDNISYSKISSEASVPIVMPSRLVSLIGVELNLLTALHRCPVCSNARISPESPMCF